MLKFQIRSDRCLWTSYLRGVATWSGRDYELTMNRPMPQEALSQWYPVYRYRDSMVISPGLERLGVETCMQAGSLCGSLW